MNNQPIVIEDTDTVDLTNRTGWDDHLKALVDSGAKVRESVVGDSTFTVVTFSMEGGE